ncbi:N-acetylmuramic acid 6-phosphate etherase [Sulfobacillus thermosulfidooxidans DSM 9293]|uniref:N-acetylmuramic acid 6-phosphate etherase n=2 Tax=Sulfobacillus thermosulfidooxidans TaxID=28034 RepID=A0A1W1WJA7_SULTA|nr:N-acetylmuramic acid 6-phosphate etherase [Sulfobacillus thermosulfidooxidans]PSR27517.1 MAG: N-acetylmuramic acid 6-phosphate etherase [Sulfobacillus thermosulfidooxidans]SMC06336.1 N-acetylmuramic acid 6-phosphate etherase [Sulfobacillus thermosulfidooxidans DSM 9293]
MEPDKSIERLETEMWDRTIPWLENLSTAEMLRAINQADQAVPILVGEQIPVISEAVDLIALVLQRGGRLFYVGAGTSGRLGILDAAECPPTFNTDPTMIQAIMAGGQDAILHAVEGAEDDVEAGAHAVKDYGIDERDVVVGLSASGRTPFVLGALREARQLGARTISVNCNHDPETQPYSDITIVIPTGPEMIMGSTRLKAGTATKLVLNMLSTGAMIRLGKTYHNLMVDVKATNFKLRERARRIVMLAADVDYPTADILLTQSGYEVKTAILMHLLHVDAKEARQLLTDHQGMLDSLL